MDSSQNGTAGLPYFFINAFQKCASILVVAYGKHGCTLLFQEHFSFLPTELDVIPDCQRSVNSPNLLLMS